MTLEQLKLDLASTMVNIIDNNRDYRVMRREYDTPFAEAWEVNLKDIIDRKFVPCLMCGEDIVPRLLLRKQNGLEPVFCSPPCRVKHSIMRMTKINENISINDTVDLFIKHGLTVELGKSERKTNQKDNRATQKAIMIETNRLLKAILKQLEEANGNRKA